MIVGFNHHKAEVRIRSTMIMEIRYRAYQHNAEKLQEILNRMYNAKNYEHNYLTPKLY